MIRTIRIRNGVMGILKSKGYKGNARSLRKVIFCTFMSDCS